MAQKNYTASNKIVYSKRSGPVCVQRLAAVFILGLIAGNLHFCMAESLATKNKKANRLFEQGKYAEAEKVYLSAQVDSPGKPEILYNLGNALVKQKRYREGIQALGQSVNKGDKKIKEKGWYNTGNAFFSAGNYGDSAAAFVEALKLDPVDKDAKHNLELALMKLKQQAQENSEKNQKDQKNQNSKDSDKEKSSGGKDTRPQQPDEKKDATGDRQNEQMSSQANRAQHREGSLSKERALQLLEAMQNQELEEQRRLLAKRTKERAGGKDW